MKTIFKFEHPSGKTLEIPVECEMIDGEESFGPIASRQIEAAIEKEWPGWFDKRKKKV